MLPAGRGATPCLPTACGDGFCSKGVVGPGWKCYNPCFFAARKENALASDANLPPEPPDGDDLPPEESPAEGAGESPPEGQGRIVQQSIEDELKDSYLTYAMSVIVSRALPDVATG